MKLCIFPYSINHWLLLHPKHQSSPVSPVPALSIPRALTHIPSHSHFRTHQSAFHTPPPSLPSKTIARFLLLSCSSPPNYCDPGDSPLWLSLTSQDPPWFSSLFPAAPLTFLPLLVAVLQYWVPAPSPRFASPTDCLKCPLLPTPSVYPHSSHPLRPNTNNSSLLNLCRAEWSTCELALQTYNACFLVHSSGPESYLQGWAYAVAFFIWLLFSLIAHTLLFLPPLNY